MSSHAQITANQRNAQLSTGPTSPEGKGKSSLNAVKTGLTGRTVLLPSDDAAAYEAHIASFFSTYKPVGEQEQHLVQSLADTEWRLLRIPALEFGIYAVGRIELAAEYAQEDPHVRNQLIEAKIFLLYQRQLNNLSIQENRLRRQREKDAATLRERQETRRREQRIQLTKAAKSYIQAVHEQRHDVWEPAGNGFDFSITEVEVRALEIKPDLFERWALEQIVREENAA